MRFFFLVCVVVSILSPGVARMCGKCDIGNNACCEFTDNLGRLKDQPGYPNCFYKDCFTLGWPGTKRGKDCGKPCECWLNGPARWTRLRRSTPRICLEDSVNRCVFCLREWDKYCYLCTEMAMVLRR